MDLKQLSNFVHVVEAQSLSRAAAILRVAQPALSRQVRALEHELGVELLTRHGWGVTPTHAGRILVEHARRVLREAQLARDAVKTLQAEPSGTLSFGAPTSLALVLLPGLARIFRKHYPNVRLHLIEGFSGSIHEWVLSGRLDIAVLYEQRAMGSLDMSPLLRDHMVVVGPSGRFSQAEPLPVSALVSLPLILPSRPHRLRLLVEDFQLEFNLELRVIMEVDALLALMELVRLGEGFTLLPYSAVHEKILRGELSCAELEPQGLSRTLLMVRPSDRSPTPNTEALERELARMVWDNAEIMRWEPLAPRPLADEPELPV